MTAVESSTESDLLQFFKVLGNESRLRLIGLVAERERSVGDLAAALGLTEPTVSHHLAMLRKIGLVRQRVQGTTHWYALDADALPGLARRLLNGSEITGRSGRGPAFDAEEAAMRAFVTAAGTLTHLPASRKKRWIILAWLARQFEEGRAYPEAEVNGRLIERHPDFATIRREFIGYRMMEREGGIYRRIPETEWVREGASP